jgi:hypothetical protein
MVGNTRSFGLTTQNMYLLRVNKKGDTLWTRTSSHFFGGSGNDLQLTKENDLFVSGATMDGFSLAQMMKFNSNGNLLWAKGITPNLGDFSHIKKVNDNEYALFGDNIDSALSYQLRLMLVDSSGSVLSTKTYGSLYSDEITDCIVLNSGFVVTGSVSCVPLPEQGFIFLMKMDSTGNILWSRKFLTPSCNVYAGNLVETNEGGYAVTGGYCSGAPDILLIKTDSLGNLLWSKTYGGSFGDFSYKLLHMPDDGFLIAGNSTSFNPAAKTQTYLIRTNSDGDTLWTKSFGDQQSVAQLKDIIQTYSGGYALLVQSDGWSSTGTGDYDFTLLVLDSLFNSNCYSYGTNTIVSDVVIYDSSFSMPTYNHVEQINNLNPIILSGGIVRTWCTDTSDLNVGINESYNITLFPNPVNEALTISYAFLGESTFELFDVLGVKRKMITLKESEKNQVINLSEFGNGYYLYQVRDRNNTILKKGKLLIIK